MEQRTKRFAVSVIEFVSKLPRNDAGAVIGRQLLRSATLIGANYREANRGVSRADFANKIGNVQKEAAETQYWLELLIDAKIGKGSAILALHNESSKLLAIFTTIGKRLKG